MRRNSSLLLLSLALMLQTACVSNIPVEDFALARAAYESARECDSIKYAPALWYKAEQTYREGQLFFKDRRYDNAQQRFIEAKFLAEKAENAARIARFKTGDGVP